MSDATIGYVYKTQIYTGKNLEFTIEADLSSRVLLELMTLTDITDNYCTGPEIYLTLYDKGINCCGTVRTNRQSFLGELIKSKQDKVDRRY